MDDHIAQFTAITGASVEQAESYLAISDGQLEQAVALYFEDPSLASSGPARSELPPRPTTTSRGYSEDAHGIVTIDSDSDDLENDVEEVQMHDVPHEQQTGIIGGPDTSSDAEMARRLQEEMYGGAGAGGASLEDDIRAPMARTRETLVGGAADMDPSLMDDEDISAMVQEQMRARQSRRRGGGYGIFNQRDTPTSIWNTDPAEAAGASTADELNRARLAAATDGQSERTSRARGLAEMFRPPWELITRVSSFDDAKSSGREENKWILVNVQDASVFDCSVLNRDLWKDKEVQNIIRENFVFLQFGKDDDRLIGGVAQDYMQYYFGAAKDDNNAYPHIAIVDPRTGEQVKVWSGAPVPTKSEFLMQVFEFLDRYSLSEDAKNPVAKRKSEKRTERDVSRMTEQEQMEMAIAQSMAAADEKSGDDDPDELTKSVTLDKGKGKANDSHSQPAQPISPFTGISSTNPHVEPTADPVKTTRIQFRYSGGRVVRRFQVDDQVRRLYEWLKAEPLEGHAAKEFELMFMGKNLIDSLDATIEGAGLKNGSVMIEFIDNDDG